jgi:hypothetical protein
LRGRPLKRGRGSYAAASSGSTTPASVVDGGVALAGAEERLDDARLNEFFADARLKWVLRRAFLAVPSGVD